jgi:hypothetical protein
MATSTSSLDMSVRANWRRRPGEAARQDRLKNNGRKDQGGHVNWCPPDENSACRYQSANVNRRVLTTSRSHLSFHKSKERAVHIVGADRHVEERCFGSPRLNGGDDCNNCVSSHISYRQDALTPRPLGRISCGSRNRLLNGRA